MRERLSSRRFQLWVVLLSAAAALALILPIGASAITPAQCDARANDTPSKLVECIQQADLMAHMQAFQDIANANLGADGHPSRNSGEPGYAASAHYVADLMTAAGYDVHIQTYKLTYYSYVGTPSFSEVSPTPQTFQVVSDWYPGKVTTGSALGSIQPAGGIVLPPTPSPSSTSGCAATDFNGFVAGRIALIQRGGCFYGIKVLNAQAAGAAGVIIFNEGNPGRTAATPGSFFDAAGNEFIPTIPVGFASFAVGQNLYDEYQAAVGAHTALPVVNLDIAAIIDPNRDDYNVIADSKGGDKNHVVVDAHLDAIYGAGMLDNASGSAAILDIAQKMKNVNPVNKLRFIWFGGEELGLLGSAAYIDSLSSNDLSHIGYDLDADVFGTPNYIIGVVDPAAPDFFGGTVSQTFPNRVYKASTIARDMAVNYFNSVGLNHEFLSPGGTDAFNFNLVGVPASGLLTGQDCCKSQHEVDLFGGQLGNYEGNLTPPNQFDGGCVDNPFRWCDNINNVDPVNMTTVSKAFATMVIGMAMDTKVMSASGSAVFKKKLPIAGEVGRRFTSK